MNVFKFIIAYMWGIWLFYWLYSAQKAKKSVDNKGFLEWTGKRLALIVIMFLLLRMPGVESTLHSANVILIPWVQAIGVMLCFIGITFMIWARVHLGRNWGEPRSVKQNPELVTSGPYKYVRHPIYSGAITAMFGSALVAGLLWFVVVIGLSIYFILSIKPEEKTMSANFPKEYAAYKKRSKALIPFLY